MRSIINIHAILEKVTSFLEYINIINPGFKYKLDQTVHFCVLCVIKQAIFHARSPRSLTKKSL